MNKYCLESLVNKKAHDYSDHVLLLFDSVSLYSSIQLFANAHHLAADIGLGDFSIVACHIDVGVSENLSDNIYRHPVFDSQTCEGMAGAMSCQVLVDIAYRSYLFQVAVHPLVARYGQQLPAFESGTFVFLQ